MRMLVYAGLQFAAAFYLIYFESADPTATFVAGAACAFGMITIALEMSVLVKGWRRHG